jgi:putative oxidoreductase
MATATTQPDTLDDEPTQPLAHPRDAARVLPLIGRILYAAIFLMATPNHFSAKGADYAASAGVPWPDVAVPLAGLLALIGGLSVLLGYKAKMGGWLLVLFLVPVTLIMHRFWGLGDPQVEQMQMIHFMKNLSLLGGALFVTYFGAGPLSLDARIARKTAVLGTP